MLFKKSFDNFQKPKEHDLASCTARCCRHETWDENTDISPRRPSADTLARYAGYRLWNIEEKGF